MDFNDDIDKALWTQAKVYMNHPYSVLTGWCITFAGFAVVILFGG